MKRNWMIARWLKRLFSSAKPVAKKRRRTARLALERLEERWLPSGMTFTVTTTNDAGAVPLSLRQAIIDSNGNNPGAGNFNTINFNIGAPGVVETINLASGLPPITEPVSINGYSESGAAPSTNPNTQASNATLLIVLNGTGASGNGLDFETGSSGSQVQGLVIQHFSSNGIRINGTSDILADGNFIGTNVAGTAAAGNDVGVELTGGATGNTIGGTASGAGNLISGNSSSYGVQLYGTGTSGNVVLGNLIGADVTGTAKLGNFRGVVIEAGASANTVGGVAAGARNVISGNSNHGVYLYNTGTSANVVLGNLIGVDSNGTASLGNTADGVEIEDGPTANTLGGAVSGAANVISGNRAGVFLYGSQTSGNVLLGNLIGTDIHGTASLPNSIDGVDLFNTSGNTIGGVSSGAGNVISGNTGQGINLGSATSANVVLGNLIGVDINGTAKLGNTQSGVQIFGGNSANTIGGTASGAGNVISGNGTYGVLVSEFGTSNNIVLGNLIGTDVHGTAKLGNTEAGVKIANEATANTIGGTATGAANVISGNGSNGVYVRDFGTTGNVVLGNLIGTDIHGTAKLGNTDDGVSSAARAAANTIGGAASGAANVLSGNGTYGVLLSGTSGNVVLGNLIGTDIHGTADLGNYSGVFIDAGATANTVGGTATGAGNVISGNSEYGVSIFNASNGTSGNVVLGNLIGTDIHGTASLGNFTGVNIAGASANTIGGAVSGAGNVISGNTSVGVVIHNAGASANVVLGNLIGTDIHGTATLGNSREGVQVLASATANTIGGAASGAGNVISGNGINGVEIDGGGTSGNLVLGNFIGTDINGTAALGNTNDGVLIDSGATANTIGGTATGAGNVISANAVGVELGGHITDNTVIGNLIGTSIGASVALGNTIGLLLDGSGDTITASTAAGQNTIEANQVAIELNTTATGNVVLGMTIGTNAAGTTALPLPNTIGLLVLGGGNTIGGTGSGASNIISGNAGTGLEIQGASATCNLVIGNFIGVESGGVGDIANGGDGVLIDAGASGNTVGTGNIISGNRMNGVEIAGAGSSANLIIGNLIGTNNSFSDGAAGNGNDGVLIDSGATDNTIGGTASGDANTIASNTKNGVEIAGAGTSDILIIGNLIEASYVYSSYYSEFFPVPNGNDGVLIDSGATGNTVGGTTSGAGNLISGNGAAGVGISGTGTSGNLVLGNLIGADSSGTAAFANSGDGVLVNAGATANTIGGGNVISANDGNGVEINGSGSSANVVLGNLIGTDVNGTANLGNSEDGVLLTNGTTRNTIGGTSSIAGNVISGNDTNGVEISGSGTSGNLVEGNLIGTDINGTAALGNTNDGVLIDSGATANTIDGVVAAPTANVISGNGNNGVEIDSSGTSGNVVLGNFIGTDSHGTAKLGNTHDGVAIESGATANTIGGTASGSANVISGNNSIGVYITGSGTSGNVVLGNLIGTDITGTAALPNFDGVYVNDAAANTIGGSASGAGNLISGNTSIGVVLYGTSSSGNVVLGNLIGTDVSGTAPFVFRETVGVRILGGATANTIGGAASGAANVISNNIDYGVGLFQTGTSGNVVLGNLIGTDIHGTAAIGNLGADVVINQASANTVGGLASGAANVISGSVDADGVYMENTSGNVVLGNLIGTDINGTAALGNASAGVRLSVAATANTIGGTVTGAGNVISGNLNGVVITDHYGGGTSGNIVLGNFIGTNKFGTAILANANDGVLIVVGATANTIGSAASGAGNVISGNSVNGVEIAGTSDNVVLGNLIGTGKNGTAKLGNTHDGVLLGSGATANTIGGGNLISGNASNGVEINGSATTGNVVLGNLIGTDVNGTASLSNNHDGVFLANSTMLNTIGGTASGAGNVISGNGNDGVDIDDAPPPGMSSDNVVLGNLIGTQSNGTVALANGNDGVAIDKAASGNTIGGTTSGAGNVISGNNSIGVYITGSGTSGNVVLGNLIGTDVNGTAKLGNTVEGVGIYFGATANTVGGTASGAGNVVSGNGRYGVGLHGGGTSGNVVLGNLIGADVTGAAALGNGIDGVYIESATAITVGGSAPGAANVISGNGFNGVFIINGGTTGNVVLGNKIGTDLTGTAKLGNTQAGVVIGSGPTANTVGGTASGAANVISGNGYVGVYLGRHDGQRRAGQHDRHGRPWHGQTRQYPGRRDDPG